MYVGFFSRRRGRIFSFSKTLLCVDEALLSRMCTHPGGRIDSTSKTKYIEI